MEIWGGGRFRRMKLAYGASRLWSTLKRSYYETEGNLPKSQQKSTDQRVRSAWKRQQTDHGRKIQAQIPRKKGLAGWHENGIFRQRSCIKIQAEVSV